MEIIEGNWVEIDASQLRGRSNFPFAINGLAFRSPTVLAWEANQAEAEIQVIVENEGEFRPAEPYADWPVQAVD
jgi:hypothetical protein